MKFEGLPDDVITAKAVAVLRSIFGDHNVPEVHTTCAQSIRMCIQSRHSMTASSPSAEGESCDSLEAGRVCSWLLLLCGRWL